MDIDWNDERAIGLKCWFNSLPTPTNPELIPSYLRADELHPLVEVEASINGNMYWYNSGKNELRCAGYIRIAQGEKTPYDGKGQPVPDGVRVTIWDGNRVVSAGTLAQLSENSRWDMATHYQVQEMPFKFNDSDVTVPIKQSTINAVIDTLRYTKTNIVTGNWYAGKVQDIATIDKLIKELKDK